MKNLPIPSISVLQSADETLLITLFGTLFFFSLFTIFLCRKGGNKADTQSRIIDIASDGVGVNPYEEKGKEKGKKRKFFKLNPKKSAKARRRIRQIEDELYNVGIEMPVKDFLLYWIGSMLLLTIALTFAGVEPLISCIVMTVVALLPGIIIKSKKKKRCQIIESQLVDCIHLLSNAMKAGHSFTQAMNTIAQEMDGPIAEEFGRVFLETQHGMNLDDSLEAMCARVGSADLSMMCTAVEIQRQVGGNLSQILMNISGTIKARLKLKADIKVKTASGRASGILIGALPVVLFVMFKILNPEYMTFFFSGLPGLLCIVFCVVMEIIGFFVINKIVSIKY